MESASSGPNMPGPVRAWTNFRQEPVTSKRLGGAATGTGGDVNAMIIPGYGHMPAVGFEWTVIGTQTILTPVLTSVGLNIGMDQTDNDGIEINLGITARSPFAFTVGTDRFFIRLKAKIEDASGADPLMIGFRKAAAHAASHDDYTDLAGIGCVAGTIKINTILNNAATTVTSTGEAWADAQEVTLKVIVETDGSVTYEIDGDAPATTAAFTLDTGDVMIPFVLFMHGTDVAGTVELTEFECGAL